MCFPQKYVNFTKITGALGDRWEVQTAETPQSKVTTLMLGPSFIHYHYAMLTARKIVSLCN